MNLYTRCLLEIQDGRRWEAVRWLCRGLSYNLHVPEIVLAGRKESRSDGAWSRAVNTRLPSLMTWARRRDAPPRWLAGIKAFLCDAETMPVGEKVAEAFAELRAGQLDAGRLPPSTDL